MSRLHFLELGNGLTTSIKGMLAPRRKTATGRQMNRAGQSALDRKQAPLLFFMNLRNGVEQSHRVRMMRVVK